MSDQYDYPNEESPVVSGPVPPPEAENPLMPMSLVTQLTTAEIDQQIATARHYPRSPAAARDRMISLATFDHRMAAECIYSVPRGGKNVRGPSIRFAEIVLNSWGNVRCAARVTHEDRIERYVEAEAIVHDLETNMGFVARARRRIELKKSKKTVDLDMIQLAGSAAVSVARRNAILGAIPKPVWYQAQEAVESVIKGEQKTLADRRDKAIASFNSAGISTERILRALEVAHLDDITLEHLVDLTGMREAYKSGESTLADLFPEERAAGPKPETLEDKLTTIARVNPQTGEITESGAKPPSAPGGAGVAENSVGATPATAKPQRGPKGARKPSVQERLQIEGDAKAAQGMRRLREWMDELSSEDLAHITALMERTWRETAQKAAA